MQSGADAQPGQPARPAWTNTATKADKPNIDKWWVPAAVGRQGDANFKPADGPIDGVMAWQGDIRDQNRRGGARRIYIIWDRATKTYWGVSERAGIVELRRCPNRTNVYIACKGKRKTGNTMDNGEEQTVLDFELYCEKLLDKPVVVAAPVADSGFTPPASDDDVPF